MTLERTIAKHLLDIEAVALNHQFTVIIELQCHIQKFVVKLLPE